MPISHLCNGIRTIKLLLKILQENLPSSSGVFIEVPKDKFASLKEERSNYDEFGNVCPTGRQVGRDLRVLR